MSSDAKRDNRLSVRLLWWLCRAVAVMPRVVQYRVLGGLIYVVLRYVLHYRRWLIVRQLTEAFPDKSSEQIAQICNRYYRTLAETVIGTMRLAGMGYDERRAVMQTTPPADVAEAVHGRNFVILASHHHLWEFAQFVGLAFPHYMLCGYHPLKNRTWDDLYFRLRSNENCLPVPSNQLLRSFIKYKDEGFEGRPLIIGLIADQNSPPQGDVHWYDFLNHKTLFFEGGEHLATKYGMPVLYCGLERIEAGCYKAHLQLIYDGVSPIEKHEITERYVRALEEDVRRAPEYWMWSHRRWKFAPDPVTGAPVTVDYSRKSKPSK